MSDPDRLAAIKARMEAAFAMPTTGPQRDAWMRWINTMREDVPWLVGEVQDRRTDLAMALTQLQDAVGEIERLRGLLRGELADLWTDLEQAIRRAHNGQWSMECAWFLDRIKALTQRVGAAPWEQLPITLLESGLYQRTHADLGIDAPVDMARVAEARAVINKSVT